MEPGFGIKENQMENQELEKKLYEKAPIFFRNRTLPATQTCMCWGIECGDGWYGPLEKFVTKVENVNRLLMPYNRCIVADQIKSKWADICVYWHMALYDEHAETALPELDEEKQSIVSTLESLVDIAVENLGEECERTCELCGRRGELKTDIVTCGSWLTRKCLPCAQARERESGRVMFFRDGFGFLNPYTSGQVSYGSSNYGCFMGLYYSELHPEHRVIFKCLKDPREVQTIAFDMGLCEQTDRAIDVMRRVLPSKFGHESERMDLLSTNGLDLCFSNSRHENFWGSCICNECKDKEHHNHYGKLLMELRDSIGSKKEPADGK